MATPKEAHTLSSYYAKKYKELYGFDAVFSRYSARWGFDTILITMSVKDAKGLLDYYFTTRGSHNHEIDWFFYNYDKLLKSKSISEKDSEELKRRREASRKRTEEWRKRVRGEG